MGLFGQFANVYASVQKTIYQRTRSATNSFGLSNIENVSELKPWVRISSAVHQGLVLGTSISLDPSFNNLYGKNSTTSGKIGNNFKGEPVFADSTVYQRGLRPSPIIESINIENGAEGLTRKLTFQIKCFSLPQLDTVTKYFLEPRFYVLAEWGWNTTKGYSGLANIQNTTVANAVCEMVQYMNLGVLKEKRSGSEGHYDAFLGVITGGNVDFGDNETYVVNVEVLTQGEIPAYLQQHKGSVEKIDATGVDPVNVAKSSLMFNVQAEIKIAEAADETVGQALFMYMFNDLPPQKQIQQIKDLQFQTTTQVSNSGIKVDSDWLTNFPDSLYWCQEWQYLNMNTTYRDRIREKLKDQAEIRLSDGREGIVNSEQPLVSDARYIRMELAWKILNELGKGEVVRDTYSCEGKNVSVPNNTISIENTICRAHKHIFSMNREFLFIPNATTPDFGLEQIFASPSENTGFLVVKDGKIVERNIRHYHPAPKSYQFPRGKSLKEALADNNSELGEAFDDSYRLIDKDEFTWGYLKDLFINFDFFVECLNRNGSLIKDIAIDILNGLSQGVNMFWDFQIVEVGSTHPKDKGVQQLVVVDANFNGLPVGGKLVDDTDNAPDTLSLQIMGTNSCLLDVNLKLQVQGAMANQIMAQRGSLLTDTETSTANSSATIEDKVEDFSGLFSTGLVDNLTNKIAEIQSRVGASGGGGGPAPGSRGSTVPVFGVDADGRETILYKDILYTYSPPQDFYDPITGAFLYTNPEKTARDKYTEVLAREIRERIRAEADANWIMFMSKAAVFPRKQNPNVMDFETTNAVFEDPYNDAKFDQLIVGVWEDSQLLRQVYEFDMINPNNSADIRFEAKRNPGFLPIEITFTLHGVSGFKVGDMIHFRDLPHVYRTKIFTVMNISNSIEGDIWKTIITAACRNLPAPGYSSTPPPPPPPDPGSGGAGSGVDWTTD